MRRKLLTERKKEYLKLKGYELNEVKKEKQTTLGGEDGIQRKIKN